MYAFLTESIGMVQVIPHGVVSKWTSKKKVPIAGFLCQHNGHHESAPVLHALSTPCVPTYLDRAGMPLSTDDKSFEVFVGSTRIKFDSEREAFKFCEDYSRRIARDLSATVWDASSLGDVMPQRSPTLGQFVALTRHLDTPQGWTRGRKSVLVVVMDWKVGDKSMSPYSQQEHNPIPNYRSKIFPAVNEAFTRMSYGQFGIEVTFVPEVIRYSRDRIAYTSRKMPFPSLYNAAKESMEGYTSQYRFDDYDLVFVIAPQVNPTGTKGVAWVGQKGAMCNGCETLSDSFKVMVAVHELGHNLGLKHASSSSLEYGNVFDWMGNYPDVVGLHYGLGYKWRLGWISDRSLYEIGDADLSGLSAEVELNPFDAETAPQGEQIVGVHVSLSGLDSDLWVSYRSSVAGDKQGVYVVYQDKDQTNSELVDAACGTISQQDAHLKVGWTFLEKSHKVAIKVLAVSATAAKVHVFAVGPADVSNLYAAPGFTDGVTRCPASCQDADLLVPQYSCAELQGMGYCGSGELTMMGHRYSIKGDICPATCGTCAAGASDSQSSGPAAAGGSPPAPAACKDVNVRISGKTCGGAARAGWCSMETTSGQTVGMDLCPLSCGQCPQSIEASSEPFVEPEITDTSGTVSFAVGGARSVGGAAPAKAAEFDCEAGLGKWEAGWSEAKKKWCCENEGKGWQGCKEKSEPFDCEAGLPKWKTGWSESKKEWCCENKEKGCEDPFDCDAGLPKWETGWSEEKKEWCCEHEKKGCEAPTPAPPPRAPAPPPPAPTPPQDSPAFNCTSGNSSKWSANKKLWCYEHWEDQLKYMVHDCSADFDEWEDKWSDEKKSWCCENVERGCPDAPATTLAPYDCSDGFFTWEDAWNETKKDWCCLNAGRGCPQESNATSSEKGNGSTPGGKTGKHDSSASKLKGGKDRPDTFNCSEKQSEAEFWSVGKKAWCCAKELVGCDEDPEEAPAQTAFDCAAGFNNWDAGWSDEKKDWCCVHEKRGCEVSQPFDCNAGFNNWKAGWSSEKKEWCCDFQAVGCKNVTEGSSEGSANQNKVASEAVTVSGTTATTTAATSLPYDCDKDAARWKKAWTTGKKAWCCVHKKLGCPIATTTTATGTTTSTSTTTTFSDASTTTTSTGAPCNNLCFYEGVEASCALRIRFAASHKFADSTRQCEDAHASVLGVCAECHGCTAVAARCHGSNSTATKTTSTTSTLRTTTFTDTTPPTTRTFADTTPLASTTEMVAEVSEETAKDSVAAGAAAASLDFDCSAGYAHWELGWSALKKRWCCERWTVACENESAQEETTPDPEGQPQPFNCSAGFKNWETGWSEGKKSWCCHNEGTGCPTTTTPWTYNCSAGLSNWRREWADSKKHWCCSHEELGCEQKPVSLALVEQSQIQTGSVGERLARAPEAAVSEGLARLQGGSRLSVLCVVGGLVLTAVATVGRQITGARRHSLPRGGPGDSYALAQEGPMEPLTAGSDRDSDSDDFSPPSESPLHAVARQIALSRPVAGSRGRVPPPGQRYARLGSEELL